jgi:hypothetical protein
MNHHFSRNRFVAGTMFFLLLLVSGGTRAMAQSAVLSGVVKDASNAVVPNASIELLQEATQTKQTAVTNGSGFYSVPNLVPGTYTLTVSGQGFQTESKVSRSRSTAAERT